MPIYMVDVEFVPEMVEAENYEDARKKVCAEIDLAPQIGKDETGYCDFCGEQASERFETTWMCSKCFDENVMETTKNGKPYFYLKEV